MAVSPAFLNYHGFPYSLCISLNDQIVHGFPGKRELVEGDLLSVDCGVVLNKYIGDSAYTFAVGEVSEGVKKLMRVTMECLDLGVQKSGGRDARRRYRVCGTGTC